MANLNFSSLNSLVSSATDGLSDTVVGLAKSAASALGLGGRVTSKILTATQGKSTVNRMMNTNVSFENATLDWRVKISLAASADYLYADDSNQLLSPIRASAGVIFPYTPDIQMSHMARYGSANLTHSNYNNYSYEGSEVQAITITGDFTVQTQEEGRYVLACIYFFRAATKMFFGSGANIGHPPPMVFLNGYGSHYFPNVPCVITSFQHKMPQEVDYIQVSAPSASPAAGGVSLTPEITRVPTTSQITITLQPIYSRKNTSENFNLDSFAQGKLLDKGFI
jgi:hypothetical protein